MPKRNIEQELEEDLQNLKAFHRGEKELVTRTIDRSIPPVGETRKRLGLTQEGFAALLGVSLRTLQDWEQGRHQPTGPARTLLKIADQEPDVFLRVR